MISVDQTPLGSTPSSTPATYAGVFDLIRELFAKLPEAKVRGYSSRRFSFNQAGGRCEACEGAGQKRIEMHFLPDVWITCDACGGAATRRRHWPSHFTVRPIADVLNMSVAGRIEFFANVPRIRRILQTLYDVGLGYSRLGQAAPTFSGGEAQRVKLAAELARPDTGKTLYILDEPTTGLHFDDVRKLLDVIHRLADLGNTVVVIEHNLEVIKTADWVIDLGPEAGIGGGDLVAEGTPEASRQEPAQPHRVGFSSRCWRPGRWLERPRFSLKSERNKQEKDERRESSGSKKRQTDRAGGTAEDAKTPRRQSRELQPRPRPPGKSTAANGTPATVSPRTAVRCDGTDESSNGSSTRSRPWAIPTPTRMPAQDLHPQIGRSESRANPRVGSGQDQLPVLSRNDDIRVGHSDAVFCPQNTFRARHLENQLALIPFHESETPVLCDQPRLKITEIGPFQEITIVGHAAEDFETLAFDSFLRKAISAFLEIGKPSKLVRASELAELRGADDSVTVLPWAVGWKAARGPRAPAAFARVAISGSGASLRVLVKPREAIGLDGDVSGRG